ncbi:MAG: helix-turn-helix domain-containing protein [Chloroflexota bacterium]
MRPSQPTAGTRDDAALERRLEELQALQTIAHAVASELELPAVLQAIVTKICENSSWDICDIIAVNEPAGRTELLARFPPSDNADLPRSWPLSMGRVTIGVLERGAPLCLRDVFEDTDSPTWHESARQRGYRAALVVPLRFKDPPSAIWLLTREPHEASEAEIAHAVAIADHVSVALQNARLYDRQREATARFERLLDTQTRLIHQVLAGATLDVLAQVSARILGNPVTVLDQLSHAIARWPAGDSSQSADGRTLDHTREARADQPWLSRLVRERKLAPMATTIVERDAVSPPLPCRILVAPLAAGNQALGYLLVSEEDRPFEPLDEVISQQVGLAAAIELMRQSSAFEAENRVRSDVLQRLFSGAWTDRREMVRQASHLSLDLRHPNGLLLIRPAANDAPSRDALAHERLLAGLIPLLTRQNPGIVAVVMVDLIVALVPIRDAMPDLQAEAARFARTLERELGHPPLIVVGPVASGPDQYPNAKRECDRAIRVCDILQKIGVVTLAELGAYRLLGTLDRDDGMQRFVDDLLGPLLAYEQRRHTDLLGTLKAYFANNCSPYHTAEQLFIHISTLRYRLERVRTLTSFDLDDPETRFSLQLALRCHELIGQSARR